MDWKDIAETVGKAAPILGTLLGGPAGAAVGSIIASALGTGNSADDVSTAIAADPASLVKLREIEASKTVRLQELATDMAKHDLAVAAADRDSARQREAKTGDTLTPRSLALLVTAGFFGVLAQLLIVGKPEQGGDALLVMLGALGGAWGSVIAYYFGSSAGSAAKTELLGRSSR
jgi:uncharacterized membrane protein YeaQ/YmgE (transglycosylase-associated protein family)